MDTQYAGAPQDRTESSPVYAVVTPHDTTNLARLTRGLYVGGTGNLVAVMDDGTTCLFSAIPVGTILPIQCKRVNSTSTTATLIVALY
jgi:hypothetical protein